VAEDTSVSEGAVRQGISRRDLLRRGAVVGGVLWAAPVIQSLRSPAFAASPVTSTCCLCVKQPGKAQACAFDDFTCASCTAFCVSDLTTVAEFRRGTGCTCVCANARCTRKKCGLIQPSDTCDIEPCP
jgi:hypothetical protein